MDALSLRVGSQGRLRQPVDSLGAAAVRSLPSSSQPSSSSIPKRQLLSKSAVARVYQEHGVKIPPHTAGALE
jgi:hypothetical protein